MQQILHVVVVGFHHKKGCQVEFSYPKLNGSGEGGLPDEWVHLPSLALPDGAHNTTDDVIFFVLPSRDNPQEAVFGISCYRQIPASDLVAKSDDVTRSTVQKSVCVLSRAPLFGALKAKLELITRAYFEERDFRKVEVLSQMYSNLCDMFNGEAVDGQAASIDISVQDLFTRFRHRALILFKLLLLERKVVFNISPAQLLGTTMLALVSLYPKMLEEGLRYCTSPCTHPETTETTSQATEEDENEDLGDEIVIPPSKAILDDDPFTKKDSFGFPLSIFTNGNLFHPYLSISYLDMIRSKSVRGFAIGATNALFVTKRDLIDAIVTREVSLTSADLRFGDYILRSIEENKKSSAVFEGNDEWLRLRMREYLLAMAASSRSDLAVAVADYGAPFIHSWRFTRNYRIWMLGQHEDLSGVAPGHAFAGQLGVYDVLLRVEHTVSGSEGARRALSAITSTGKNIGETGQKVRQSFTTWFKGGVQNAEEATESPESSATAQVLPCLSRGSKRCFRGVRVSDDAIAQGDTSGQNDRRATSSWINGSEREQLANKVKSISSWIRGTQRNEEAGSTSQSPSEESTR
nr:Late secretory pathway protein AVL9 domain containing protein [Haemonchus contortus]